MSILDNKVRIVFADYLKRGAYGEVEDMYLMMYFKYEPKFKG